MSTETPPYPGRSWWLLEALEEDPGEPCPPLLADIEADVVIVGGGYTGLWTAHNLLELSPGLRVVILERDICGGGPSGRNGGFVNGFWTYLGEHVELFGAERALALARAGERSVVELGEWCERHDVDAWYVRKGELAAATSPAQDGRWHGMVDVARRLGVGDRALELSPDDVRARLVLPHRSGGMLVRESATVQPARLARGLRRVVHEQGARIYETTPARRLRAGDPSVLYTPGGSVTAGTVVLATNAWLASLPALRSRLTVRGSYIVLTAPAPERLAEIAWTGGESLWNYRSAVNYVRTTRDGRIAFGTGGMQPGLGTRVDPSFDWDARLVAEVARQFRRMFPSFQAVPLEAAWGGPIDVSGAHLVFVDELAPGRVHVAAGYTGNGVGPCHLVGKILARRTLGIDDELTRLPIVGFRPKGFPPEPLRSLGGLMVNEAVLRLCAAEDVGATVGPATSFAARLPRRLGYLLGP